MDKASVRRNFRHTAEDGKAYQTKYYNLEVITAVGCRVNSPRAFRKWVTKFFDIEEKPFYSIVQSIK